MKLKIKLDPGAIMPTRAHETDASFDGDEFMAAALAKSYADKGDGENG